VNEPEGWNRTAQTRDPSEHPGMASAGGRTEGAAPRAAVALRLGGGFAPRLRAVCAGALVVALLSSCALLTGNDRNARERATIYAPDPRIQAEAGWPAVDWQLSLTPPTSARMIDSFRIAVRPTPDELQVYRGATWAKTPTDMLQDTLLRALEDSGKLPAVARQGTGFAADYRLALDLRRFEADYAGSALPAATIEVNAKLVHAVDQGIVASRTFLHAEPSTSTDVAQVVEAFSRALAVVGRDLSGWILLTGEAHERSAHPRQTGP
jgi:cholesterol transport system auxiliary component